MVHPSQQSRPAHLHHMCCKPANRALLHSDHHGVLLGQLAQHLCVQRLAEAGIHHSCRDPRLHINASAYATRHEISSTTNTVPCTKRAVGTGWTRGSTSVCTTYACTGPGWQGLCYLHDQRHPPAPASPQPPGKHSRGCRRQPAPHQRLLAAAASCQSAKVTKLRQFFSRTKLAPNIIYVKAPTCISMNKCMSMNGTLNRRTEQYFAYLLFDQPHYFSPSSPPFRVSWTAGLPPAAIQILSRHSPAGACP